MDHTEDVERLFSWLKAPMVHYREFAPQQEVAEAVSTWPVAHRAAVQTGMAIGSESAPQGDAAAKARSARERISLPLAAAQAVQHTPLPGAEGLPSAIAVETPPEAATDGRASDRPAATLGERVQAARLNLTEGDAQPAPPPAPRDAVEPWHEMTEPTIAGFDQPSPPMRQASTVRAEPNDDDRVDPVRQHPPRDREALFGGEYRGRERDVRPGNRVADRQDRSLDAVFSRLSGGRERLPDPRGRARTSPGLGSVFGRLR